MVLEYSDCRLTTELLHEANIPMGVEGQCIWCYAQGVEKVGGSDALQSLYTLGTHRPHFLLRQTAVPQRQNVSQGHVLLQTHKKLSFQTFSPCVYSIGIIRIKKTYKSHILVKNKLTKETFVENKLV